MTSQVSVVRWDGHDANSLAARCGAVQVELLAETDSTQNVAHALAEGGAPSGTVVVADSQRAGRGRMGRTWRSEPGGGVWCTVIERPQADALDVLSLRVGLYLAELLDGLAGETVHVKWPNDLMIRSLKLGGILVEARWLGRSLEWAAVGVGINVKEPSGVSDATGLGATVRRTDVLAAIVRAVRSAAARRGSLDPNELRRFAGRDALVGRHIVLPLAGKVVGVTPAGELSVAGSHGIGHVRAGTVELARTDAEERES